MRRYVNYPTEAIVKDRQVRAMFERLTDATRNTTRIALSVVAHAVLLGALLRTGHAIRIRASTPGTLSGAKVELSYLPGRAADLVAPKRVKSSPKAKERSKADLEQTAKDTPLLAPVAPPVVETATVTAPVADDRTSSPAQANTSTTANDALGTDDIKIALTTYSPSPKPDLSRVPHGTQGEVVLDVTIDPTGKVADLQILHALGYGVEGMVADTVRTWTFHPATKDGVPVASVQELHFHFGPV